MLRAEKIAERLPHFYNHRDSGSIISGLVNAMGKRIDEAEKELVSIIRTHWVDTASKDDLDRLGALYNIKRKGNEEDRNYRKRLKTAIISYKGGGTLDAIKMVVRITLRLPQDYPVHVVENVFLEEKKIIQIVENPSIRHKKTWNVRACNKWDIDPENIHDTVPDITLVVKTKNAKITDPTIINLANGESIIFKGDIESGEILKISNGKAILNDKDRTGCLSTTNMPVLPRKKSSWQYKDFKGANKGIFNRTHFDKSFFPEDIILSLTMEWIARKPATFELYLPKELLNKAGITAEYMQDIVDSVKACGVKAKVKEI